MAPRLRYTMFQVTINTNKAGNTASETDYIIRLLKDFINVRMKQQSLWKNVINIAPDYKAVRKINVDAVGIEVGPKRHFIHTHFIVTVEHTGKVQYKFTQKKWQEEVNAYIPQIKGAYCNVQLLNSRSLNYAAKHSGKRTEILTLGVQKTLKF